MKEKLLGTQPWPRSPSIAVWDGSVGWECGMGAWDGYDGWDWYDGRDVNRPHRTAVVVAIAFSFLLVILSVAKNPRILPLPLLWLWLLAFGFWLLAFVNSARATFVFHQFRPRNHSSVTAISSMRASADVRLVYSCPILSFRRFAGTTSLLETASVVLQ